MRRGGHILVFPGGAREVFKHKGEAYRLIWEERYGFVQLAVEHGYAITPYATVGAEAAFDVLLDSSDYMATPLGRYLERRGIADRYLRGGEEFPPSSSSRSCGTIGSGTCGAEGCGACSVAYDDSIELRRAIMTGLRRGALAVLIGLAAVGPALADQTFRCGSRLVEAGITQSEVLVLCGEPTSKTVEEQDVRSGNRVVGKTTVHRWTYESYGSTRVLVFDQDALKSIE